MPNKTLTLSFLVFFISSSTFASKAGVKLIRNDSLVEAGLKALNVALSEQKTENGKIYLKGEWPTQIRSTPVPATAGVGKFFGRDEEASAFTTASVINVLSQTYLRFPDLHKEKVISSIPEAVWYGVGSFQRYQDGHVYNFYPPFIKNGVRVRQAADLRLLPFWYGFTNIPNDADTTSAVNAALMYNARLNKTGFEVKDSTFAEFETYRDTDRKAMFYNRRQNRKNTGAFLTWLYDEKNPDMPRFYFAKAEKGARIPFNVNDVDCIVNVNIFKMKAMAHKKILKGYPEACEMINSMVEKDEHARCGIYYPNTLNLSYALASAEKEGDSCLKKSSHELILNKILSNQYVDGSWLNENNPWRDQVITTAFALSSLQHYGNIEDIRVKKALLYGTKYLLGKAKSEDGQVYWPSNHFSQQLR